MHDQPTVAELIQAVRNFIDTTAISELEGRSRFHARVASNVLAIVLRDLAAREENDTAEAKRLEELLGGMRGESIESLNRELASRIRNGRLTTQSDALMRHLKKTAISQLKVDQPQYSGLAQALKE